MDFELSEIESIKPLKLYSYQEDLASKAICGKNLLVVSPTNSGKTFVAIKVIQEHNKSHRLKSIKPLVFFIVPNVELAVQQHARICEYIESREVLLFQKSGSTSLMGIVSYSKVSVIVIVAQRLLNALSLPSENPNCLKISHATLLIFDECHHNTKHHPYRQIMNSYFKYRNNFANSRQSCGIQILGLTASLGSNKSTCVGNALKHIKSLCAHFDCFEISFKSQEQVDNCRGLDTKTDVERLLGGNREGTWLQNQIFSLMKDCETELAKLSNSEHIKNAAKSFLISPHCNRLDDVYQNFVGNIRINAIRFIEFSASNEIARLDFLQKFLDILLRGLHLHVGFREEDVIWFYEHTLAKSYNGNNIYASCLQQAFLETYKKSIFADWSKFTSPNETLEILIEQVLLQFRTDRHSRVIIFVRDQIHAIILQRVIKSDSRCAHLKSDFVVRDTLSEFINETMTNLNIQRSNVTETLSRFRSGDLQVLFATNMIEEGYDVPDCNLVIMYCHVTNEIAMKQAKGRARQENSRYLIVSARKSVIDKSHVNDRRDQFIEAALQQFLTADPAALRREIVSIQLEKERSQVEARPATVQRQRRGEYTLHCSDCHTAVTRADYMRLKRPSQFYCMDHTIFDRVVQQINDNVLVGVRSRFVLNEKILCAHCKNELGVLINLDGKPALSPSIRGFLFKKTGDLGFSVAKKWTKCPFDIQEL